MSFFIDYGDARLGDCVIDGGAATLNAYAKISSINKNIIQIENITHSDFTDFTAGQNILIHICATNGVDASNLGRFFIAKIELVDANKLTLDKNIFDVDLNFYYAQAVSIPQFKNLTLKNATLTPPPFDVFKFTGGILVAQVYETFQLINSNIDLTDCGIPYQKKMTYRPLNVQEMNGETDGSKFAGDENLTPLILNSGDGAAFVQAYNFICDDKSRIGNPKTHGRAKCRGAADSPFKPSNITNIGGSSILIAAENLQIIPENIAKYRSTDKPTGRGLCRCQIVSETLLDNDEKLYHFDIPANPLRVQNLGINDFGDGNLGDYVNPAFNFNNYADVVSVAGRRVYYNNKTLNGAAQFKAGGLVILRDKISAQFVLAKVLEYDETFLILDKILNAAKMQLISVAEFANLTLTDSITSNGIIAVACSENFNLQGILTANVESCDAGNAQSWNKIHGIFILAKNMTFGENAKLSGGAMLISQSADINENIFISNNNFAYQM